MAIDPGMAARVANILMQGCGYVGSAEGVLNSLGETVLQQQADKIREEIYAFAKTLNPALP